MILNRVLRFCHIPGAVCGYLMTTGGGTKHFHFCLFYGRQVLHRQVLQELASSFHQVCTCKFEKEIKIKLGLHDLTEQLLSDHITIYGFKYKFCNIQMNVLTYLGVNYEHCTIKLK